MFGGEEEDDDDAGLDQSMMGWRGVCAWDIPPESSILQSSEEVVVVHFTEAHRSVFLFWRLSPSPPLLPPPILEGQHPRTSRGEYRCRKSGNRGCIGCI